MPQLPQTPPSGFLFINKPSGPTSHDVIDQLRQITGIRKIGHAGTLDPFARGVLVVAIGRKATLKLKHLVGLDKVYRAKLKLGAISDTYDRTGKIQELRIMNHEVGINKTIIEETLKKFTGEIKQIPPMYSAKKIKGKKLYELARAGKTVERQPQKIKIYYIKLLKYRWPDLEIEVKCSSGTYIRSLAHDLGQALGCGAYLEELKRLAVGKFKLGDSVSLSKVKPHNWTKYLLRPLTSLRVKALGQNKAIPFLKVISFGTFDLLHPGHLYFLKEAKKLGNHLTVIIARDRTVEKVKGRLPQNNEQKRLKAIKKLPFVDQALLGSLDDPYKIIQEIRPDLICLGYDQKTFTEELAKHTKAKIIRLKAYHPKTYKSSLLKKIL